MSRDTLDSGALVEYLQRLCAALEDMAEELPGQIVKAKNPHINTAAKMHILDVIEKQLRWLSEDTTRTRAALVAQENSNGNSFH